ncbi:MAG: BTAD domain-containing putative transcriptional regulator, partial [Litorilinea sp.]
MEPNLVESLDAAASLYRADFLQGFSLAASAEFDDWQLLYAERLRLQLAAVLDRLARHHAQHNALDVALDYVRRRLTLDPLHEPAHRQLMQLYVDNGQQAAALRQYATCVQLLETELDVAPEPATAQLHAKILARRHAPPTDPDTPAQPAAPAHNLPTHPTRFVGRTAELTQIHELLADADCRLLTLVGPGGVGKTRLAVQAAQAHTRSQAPGKAHDVRFVSLSTLERPDQIPAA